MNQLCSSHSLHEIYVTLFHTIDEMLQEAIQESCARFAPGIRIIAVRVTKPRLPRSIEEGYQRVGEEKTRLFEATEAQRVVEKRAQTERLKLVAEAEAIAEVSAVTQAKQLAEKRAAQEAAAIEDAIVAHRVQSAADADAYAARARADANAALLTPEYLALRSVEALAGSTRVFFGDKIPATFFDVQGAADAARALAARAGGAARSGASE